VHSRSFCAPMTNPGYSPVPLLVQSDASANQCMLLMMMTSTMMMMMVMIMMMMCDYVYT